MNTVHNRTHNPLVVSSNLTRPTIWKTLAFRAWESKKPN